MHKKYSGVFVTVEGVEGSGKTTQLALMADWLRKSNFEVVLSREPGGTPFGREVRKILLDPQGPDRLPVSELLLYLADRYEDVNSLIIPAIKEGKVVLCDRYHDATIAYQGYARGISLELIKSISELIGVIKPDLTFLIDIAPEVALQRAKKRNMASTQSMSENRFEEESLLFHRKVRNGYLMLAQKEPDRFVIIDGTMTADNVFSVIKKKMEEFLRERAK